MSLDRDISLLSRVSLFGELSTDQALNGMHALPESLQGIALIKGLQFVKGKDKVLLVTPSTRTVPWLGT